jgi:hypothetical protein
MAQPSSAFSRKALGSIRTPGPIVDDRVMDRRYVPLAVAGFARMSALTSALALLEDGVGAEARLADARLHDAGLLGAVLDLAALGLAHRVGDVEGHRADLRVGHEPAGPEHAPELTDLTHHVGGRDDALEVEEDPSATLATSSSAPTKSAPASRASRSLSPFANTSTRTD